MHLITILASAFPLLVLAQSSSGNNTAYLDSVCSPAGPFTDVIPPCISITNIQTLCAPNGTTPLAYEASAQCLCNPPSSFFADWVGCRKCLQVHGGLSEQEYNGYRNILDNASKSFCSGTPTTDFAAVFAAATGAATGATTKSDLYPSNAAVSLYYKPSGTQGPDSITGSATAAIGSGRAAATNSLGSGVSAGLPRTSRAGGSASSTASGNQAVATDASLGSLALAVAGGVAIAVL